MLSILKNMKSQWKTVVLITVLLIIQAVCDLSLPNYTSRLIDVGIQNGGVEYATPIIIRASEYEKLKMVMSENELPLWELSYLLKDDGNYHLIDSSPQNSQFFKYRNESVFNRFPHYTQ